MAFTPDQYKTLLLASVGGATATVTPEVVSDQWERFATFTNNEVRYYKALLAVIDLLLGGSWKRFETRTSAGEVLHGEQPFEHLLRLARRAEAALEELGPAYSGLASDNAEGAPSVAVMEAEFPLETPGGLFPDPNSTHYIGDIYARYR